MGQRASSFFTSSSTTSQSNFNITQAGQTTDLFVKKRTSPTFQGNGQKEKVHYTDDMLTHFIDLTWNEFKKRHHISSKVKDSAELKPHQQEAWDKTLRAAESVYRERQRKVSNQANGQEERVNYTDDRLTHLIDQTWENFKRKNHISSKVESEDELKPHQQDAWNKVLLAAESEYRKRQRK